MHLGAWCAKSSNPYNMKPQDLLDEHGKALPKSFVKTLNKMVELQIILREYSDARANVKVRNPFSGVECEVTPLCYDIIQWIVSKGPAFKDMTRTDWDNARHIIVAVWPDVYFAIID